VKSVTEKILPEPDDKFAQQMGEFKTFSELEGDIENRLKKQRDEEAEHLLKNRLIDEIIKRNTFELPPSMVNYSLDRLWKEYSKQPDSDVTEEQFQEENRTGVVWNLKWQMVWPKIAEIEDIDVTQEEVDAEIDKMVEAATKNKKRIYSLFKDPERRNGLIDNMKEEKVIQFLKDNVKIKNVTLKAPKEQQSSIVSH
jgi:trigger factor